MDSSNRKKLVDALTALAEVFDKKSTEVMINTYAAALADVPIDQITVACQRAIRECRWFPKPVELRELAGEITPEARALIAWQAFSKAALDPYASVDFDDPVVNATIRNLGGWAYVTSIEDHKDFEVFLRQRFERAYVTLYRHGISAEQAAPLVGYLEEQNRFNGYDSREFNGVAINSVKRIETGLPLANVRIGATPAEKRLKIEADLKHA